jgi:hypothetical protein
MSSSREPPVDFPAPDPADLLAQATALRAQLHEWRVVAWVSALLGGGISLALVLLLVFNAPGGSCP